MNGSWSAEQREWLQAMGYDLLAPAGAAPLADGPVTVAVPAPVKALNVPGARAAAPRPAATPAAMPDLTDPLLRALLRASRCDDLAELARIAGDCASLRRNPAAKRALWPALRALRVRSRR